MQGFINVFKPSGMSSAKVVAKIKHCFKLDKVGHMGTLDPLACGILPIAIGKATRMFDYFLDKTKTYITVFKFGSTSNTLDLDGNIESNIGSVPTKEEILKILPSFLGTISQMPPQFSAKVVNGQKAYKLARNGEVVNLQPKNIIIYDFKLIEKVDSDSFKFEITCSSGTYIRSLVRDVSNKLKTVGMLTYLERTKSGAFSKENSVLLDDLLNSNIQNYIIDYLTVFPNFKVINVNINNFNRLKNGLTVTQESEDNNNTFVLNNGEVLGVGVISNKQLKLKTYLLD